MKNIYGKKRIVKDEHYMIQGRKKLQGGEEGIRE